MKPMSTLLTSSRLCDSGSSSEVKENWFGESFGGSSGRPQGPVTCKVTQGLCWCNALLMWS